MHKNRGRRLVHDFLGRCNSGVRHRIEWRRGTNPNRSSLLRTYSDRDSTALHRHGMNPIIIKSEMDIGKSALE